MSVRRVSKSGAKRFHDFMVEVREAKAEHDETRNADAARRMLAAQTKGTQEQFVRAKEESLGRVVDAHLERQDLVRRLGVKYTREETE